MAGLPPLGRQYACNHCCRLPMFWGKRLGANRLSKTTHNVKIKLDHNVKNKILLLSNIWIQFIQMETVFAQIYKLAAWREYLSHVPVVGDEQVAQFLQFVVTQWVIAVD